MGIRLALWALAVALVATLVGVELTVAVWADHSKIATTMICGISTDVIENED